MYGSASRSCALCSSPGAVQCSVGEGSPVMVSRSPVDRAGREAGGRTGDVEELARSLSALREEVDRLKRR